MGNQSGIEFQSWKDRSDGKLVTVNNQEQRFRMEDINLEVNNKNGLNLFKHKVDCSSYRCDLSLSTNALHLNSHGPELLNHTNRWVGDTKATKVWTLRSTV